METRRNPVYVVNRKGKPLDPTFRYGHVRKLMKEGKAVPISNEPFTIRLKYDTPDIVMGLYGGLDTVSERKLGNGLRIDNNGVPGNSPFSRIIIKNRYPIAKKDDI